MATQLHYAIALVALLVGGVVSQQYSSNSNFVDEGNYDYADSPPQRQQPQRPAQSARSQIPPSASFSRPNTLATGPKPTPVPILKQINRHNEDGSYTYGYEGADGSFKIETKLPTGEVMGKYGYVDDLGKVRVVEYGANKYGFQPAGEGITVAPPTLVDESTRRGPDGEIIQDDGSYYEETPAQRPLQRAPTRPASRPAPRPISRPQPAPISVPQYEEQEDYSQSSFQSQQNFAPAGPAPRPAFAPAPARPSFSSFSQGPTPPRQASVPGAISVGPAPPRPAAIPGASPVGAVPSFSQPQPIPQRAAPQRPPQQFFNPAPVYESRPVSAPVQAPPRQNYARQAAGGGILDQLQRDYALPQGGAAPLHDISFGSF